MFAVRVDPTPDHPVGFAFTDREGGVTPGPLGSLNLGRSDADDPEHVVTNVRRVREAIGLRALYTVRQVHGADVVDVTAATLHGWDDAATVGDALPGGIPLAVADAMVTRTTGVGLAIRVADCLPVLLADPAAGVVAAVHAGRDGLRRGVLDAAVGRLRRLGAASVEAVIGPHVCGACYELPAALVDEIARELPGSRSRTSWGTPAVDLGRAAQVRLEGLGCRVSRVGGCTRTSPSLHSYRRDGAQAGRQIGLVWRVSSHGQTARAG